jgi:hypothetical protein
VKEKAKSQAKGMKNVPVEMMSLSVESDEKRIK